MTTSDAVLTIDRLRAYYQMNYFGVTRDIRAVDDVSFTVERNEIYGVAGESSSGKSTLIKTIVAAMRPPLTLVGGSVHFTFRNLVCDIHALKPQELAAIRWKHLSYIMQGSMNVLNPVRRTRHTFRDFAFPHMGLSKKSFEAAVLQHLARLQLQPGVLDAFPHQLSGGMRQRVAIALATLCAPEFIVADEPTTALDVIVQHDVLAMIRQVQRDFGSSFIFVTHDLAVHANVADRIGVFYAGRLVEEGPTVDVLRRPRHPYTTHLVASLPRIGDRSRKSALPGAPPSLAAPPPGCRFHPRCPLAMERCRSEVPPLVTIAPRHRAACFAVTG
jgi:peptide/nickel transport system ATP-binding protein